MAPDASSSSGDPFGGQDPFGGSLTTTGGGGGGKDSGSSDPFANFADFGSAKVSELHLLVFIL